MASLSRELVILILQFLDEEKYKESVHKLEQESGSYFNMKYFEEEVQNGNWDVVEKYLSGFTKVEDNRYSMKMFFEIRKQKYLEALDKNDKAKAVEILVKDLKVFSSFNDDLFKEITQLLALENFRENEQLSKYGDAKSARAIMLIELKKLIEANPLFREKLQFPVLKNSRLRTLINQSLNWQHQLCKNPKPNPDIKTLFVDHSCGQQSNGALVNSPASNPLLGAFPQGPFPSLTAHGSYHSTPAHAPVPTPLAGWMSNQPAVTHPSISYGPIGLAGPSNHVSFLKHPRTPSSNFTLDFPSADSGHQSKRARTIGMPDEMNPPINLLSANHPQSHNQATHSYDDLPKTVARALNQGSKPMSMNFHPIQQTLLLVGTSIGDICLWDVGTKERLLMTNFKVWEPVKCSLPLQNVLVKDPGVSVNSLRWSSNGNLFGVAYSKHLVHIYSYNGRDDIKQHLEIEAHLGGVNDIAFSTPFKKQCFVTCGDDRTVKVWEAATGTELYTFEGHGAPVYSVCPDSKANIDYIFSTTIDGKIKGWLHDNMGSRVNHEAPGRCCSAMAYSADGSRLFLCGTSKEGESHIVEWNGVKGAVKKTYQGFCKRSVGVVQFDISRTQYLAAGDEFAIKIWHVDNPNILATIDAEGGLPASPKLRFNKEGTLLAVSTADNGIKILANADGLRLLRTFEGRIIDPYLLSESSTMPILKSSTTAAVASSSGIADRDASTIISNGENRNLIDVNPRIPDESLDEPKTWKFTEINEPAQCRSLRLVHNMRSSKISRLIYTNSGAAILALASNAVHLLWKWSRNDRNSSGKATVTASLAPQLWQPPSGIIMTNDTAGVKPEETVSCFALSKNDSYVMSASGGKISLFNMMTFKTMTTFMSPPPAATFLAFHPQDNNIIAIGMDDSTIQIYNARVDEVKSKLTGHSKRITGLAFSRKLNILISSGADSQLFAWNVDGWEKLRNKRLQIPLGRTTNPVSDTKVQFHMDQIHFLVVHEAQLAIFDANNFECIKQWVTPENSAPITHAVVSCDSQLIYASFLDATVCVFAASNLKPISQISPAAYIPANVGSSVFPVEIAAHPSEPNQFALGLTDGGVYILEPLEEEGKWGLAPPSENVSSNGMPSSSNAAAASTSTAAAAASSDQPHSQR